MELPKPPKSELDNIMVFLRFDAIERDYVPKSVKLATDAESRERAWRNESLRFWYLVVMPQRRINGQQSLITSPHEVGGYDISKYVNAVDEELLG